MTLQSVDSGCDCDHRTIFEGVACQCPCHVAPPLTEASFMRNVAALERKAGLPGRHLRAVDDA